jgi:hypothetical protein
MCIDLPKEAKTRYPLKQTFYIFHGEKTLGKEYTSIVYFNNG